MQDKCKLPVKDGVTLLGVLDESGSLAPGEVWFSWHPRGPKGEVQANAVCLPPGARVAVSRHPCLSSADVRLLSVADPARINGELLGLEDVVVFSQTSDRPDAGLMSGGDLDGDWCALPSLQGPAVACL